MSWEHRPTRRLTWLARCHRLKSACERHCLHCPVAFFLAFSKWRFWDLQSPMQKLRDKRWKNGWKAWPEKRNWLNRYFETSEFELMRVDCMCDSSTQYGWRKPVHLMCTVCKYERGHLICISDSKLPLVFAAKRSSLWPGIECEICQLQSAAKDSPI